MRSAKCTFLWVYEGGGCGGRVRAVRYLLLLVVFLGMGLGLGAREVPFVVENGLMWVKVEVPRGKPLDFMVDTGAGATVLDLGVLRRLRLERGEAVPVHGVGRKGVAFLVSDFQAKVGGVPLASEVYALGLRKRRGKEVRRIHGVLGLDFFRGRVVRFDFERGMLEVLPKAPRPGPGAVVLPLSERHDALGVPVSVNGSPALWTRLDTGCNSALEWTGSAGAGRGEAEAEVRLGGRHLRVPVGFHPEPFFPQEAGLLGCGLLSRFRVTVDGVGMRLVLEEYRAPTREGSGGGNEARQRR